MDPKVSRQLAQLKRELEQLGKGLRFNLTFIDKILDNPESMQVKAFEDGLKALKASEKLAKGKESR